MPLPNNMVRVTAESPCPVCGKDTWCLVHKSGSHAICPRTEGPHKTKAGYIHPTPKGYVPPPSEVTENRKSLTSQEVMDYLNREAVDVPPDVEFGIVGSMGLSGKSLAALDVRYDPFFAAMAFPLYRPEDNYLTPVGVRFRRRDGKKWSLKGGREGLFSAWRVESQLQPFPLVVAEGATDCAALVEAGFPNVMGKPSCSYGDGFLKRILADNRVRLRMAVIVADPDEPGRQGALSTAKSVGVPTIVLVGPTDCREYCRVHGPDRLRDQVSAAILKERSDFKTLFIHPYLDKRYTQWVSTRIEQLQPVFR